MFCSIKNKHLSQNSIHSFSLEKNNNFDYFHFPSYVSSLFLCLLLYVHEKMQKKERPDEKKLQQ